MRRSTARSATRRETELVSIRVAQHNLWIPRLVAGDLLDAECARDAETLLFAYVPPCCLCALI